MGKVGVGVPGKKGEGDHFGREHIYLFCQYKRGNIIKGGWKVYWGGGGDEQIHFVAGEKFGKIE